MKRLIISKRFFDHILTTGGWGAGYCIVGAMLLVTVAVILRYGFNNPLAWSDEVSTYFLLGACFMGIAYLQREKGHITMDFIINKMNPRARDLISGITLAGSALIMALLTWYSILIALDYTQRGITPIVGVLPAPKGILIGLLGLGFLLSIFEFARESYQHLATWWSAEKKKEKPAPEKRI